MKIPLAERLRPKSLENIVGQVHLVGKNCALRKMIESKSVYNMIFFGPPGVGKTTLANIIAEQTDRKLYKLNATSATLSDIKEITEKLDDLMHTRGVLLYLDEIQNFNKKQQQALLEYMENGKITLIASTTENPYFYVYKAILSRSVIFEFKSVSADEVEKALYRGIELMKEGDFSREFCIEKACIEKIALLSNGDVRQGLNLIEILYEQQKFEEKIEYTLEQLSNLGQNKLVNYDISGSEHYDILSAFQKSIRGSDADAAIHYLARLISVGDLPSIIRRLLVIASEDIGLAYPTAISSVKACCDSALQLGIPEARIPLAQAVLLLATAPKSNSACVAIDAAMQDIQNGIVGEVPPHIKDAHYSGASKLGYGEYQYPHAFPNHWVEQSYLPENIKGREYYKPGENKFEEGIKNYWNHVKGK